VVLGLSPDGSLLAARQEGQVTFWDVATGRAAGRISGNPADFGEVAFSPDGHWLAAGGGGSLKLWQVPGGNEQAALLVSADMQFHPGPTFSPDGQWLAFRAEEPGHVRHVTVWDLAHGRERATIPGRAGALLFSPDGKLLAFESQELSPSGPPVGRIRLWDTAAGQEIHPFEAHPGPLRVLTFSPDGRTLAVGERKGWQWAGPHDVKLWDLVSGKEQGTWKVPRGVRELRFTGDGSRLLVESFRDDPDMVWRVELALIDPAAPPEEDVQSVSFAASLSPDGRLLAQTTGMEADLVTVLELPGVRKRAELQPCHFATQLSPRGFAPDGKLLGVVEVAAGSLPSGPIVDWLRRLSGSRRSVPGPLQEAELHLYETDTGRRQGTVPAVAGTGVWFAPDGKTLVVMAPGQTPTLWDVPLRKPWDRILMWWGLLAGYLTVGWLWLGRRKKDDPPASESTRPGT
jgi:hypothetical protein